MWSSIQDEVERCLMEHGFYAEAKNYILYRWQRTERRKAINDITTGTGNPQIMDVLKEIQKDFTSNEYSLTVLAEKFSSFCKPEMSSDERLSALVKAAVELTTQEAPDWEFIAARLLNFQLTEKQEKQARISDIHSFYEKLRYLTNEGLYGSYILDSYSQQEIEEAAGFICPERDKLFNYSGLDLLLQTLPDPYSLTRTYGVCAGNVLGDSFTSCHAGETRSVAMGKKVL